MVYKIWQAVKKEMLLLSRDLGGLITLFVMPIVLVITVTLIQKSSFDTLNNEATEVLWIDNDQDSLAFKIKNQIEQAGVFKLVTHKNQEIVTEDQAQKMVKRGEYQLAFVLPKNLTHDLNSKVDFNVAKVLEQFSFSEDVDTTAIAPTPLQPKIIKMYFDPATQSVFKNGVINAIEKYVSQIENKAIYEAFQHELGDSETTDFAFNSEPFIVFNELSPIANESIKPNAVQHNVPAWTLFAIFFIIVPLSINIVKEKNQGTLVRLLSSPSPTYLILSGKVITYLVISLLQFYAMLAIGKFLFPYLGLPSLSLEGRFFALSLVALFSGLAAIGFGVLLGTIAKTQEQAAPFGATFVIILAAIGGVWIPVFAMPSFMQFIAVISPMHWGLEGFYDVLLRKASIIDMLPKIILLLLFFIVTFVVALVYDKKKRHI